MLIDNFNEKSHMLMLHTMRDADSDMNAEKDFNARIRELFANIEIVTV